MFDVAAIDEHFPHPSYREGQREAIEFATRSFAAGKRVVVIEAPTGAGKSAIAMTMADMVPRSYYLTVTKVLQGQLVEEFGGRLVELRGRSSYPCTFWQRFGPRLVQLRGMTGTRLNKILDGNPSCGDGYCRTDAPASERVSEYKCARCFLAPPDGPGKRTGKLKSLPPGMFHSACPYYEQVELATRAPRVLMNFSAFLYQTQMADRFDEPRDLMVLDESHASEQILMDFVTLVLDDRWLSKHGVKLPRLDSAPEYAIWFAERDVRRLLSDHYMDRRAAMVQEDDPGRKRSISRELDDIGRTYKRFLDFMDRMERDEHTEWVVEVEDSDDGGHRRVVLRPVTVQQFAGPMLLDRARHTLMLSATVLDAKVLCDSLGIPRERVAAYRMRNRFPAGRRPIYYEPAARVTGGPAGQARWGQALVDKVDEITLRYPGQRGIIHTQNFAIADMLLEHCRPEVRARMLHQRDFLDKGLMLERHSAVAGSILVAPAMHEGINLAGDLSRFQVIAKVPYPNFHDNKQLARRMELEPRYYDWLVALKLVQSYGRSVRSEDDWADTYVIDEAFEAFCRTRARLLPEWFTEAIVWAGRPATAPAVAR